ncbi:MAG: carbon-nitrogen hydrolase family protein [Parvularculaceae bacterium]
MAVFQAACVQMRSGATRAPNLAAATGLIEKAAAAGAQFVATPEMTNIIEKNAKRLFAEIVAEEEAEELDAFRAQAEARKIWLLIGSLALKAGEGRAVNRGFLIGPDGAIAARYDKMHIFDVDLPGGESYRESAVYDAGDCAVVAKTPLANFGLSICYDLRFPALYRRLAQEGADVLCAPAAFTKQTGEAHWEVLLRARAIETGSFVVAPAQGGHHEDGRDTYGHSLIIGPWGQILGRLDHDEPGVLLADIDTDQSADARARIPNLKLERI